MKSPLEENNNSHISHGSIGGVSSGGASSPNNLNSGKSQLFKNSVNSNKPYLAAVEQYKKICLNFF